MVAQPVRQQGFTLIEVMIAMVLTALAIMGIIALYVTETRAAGFSRHTTEAAVLAQDKIEFLRTQGPAVAVSTTELNLDASAKSGPGIYKRITTETIVVGQYADIVVEIDWSDDGLAHTIVMRARRGL
ncbi:MAG: prepilin-type N-terminal cleavage/methylation domain-containing protein [Kofleriaceae bacterium]